MLLVCVDKDEYIYIYIYIYIYNYFGFWHPTIWLRMWLKKIKKKLLKIIYFYAVSLFPSSSDCRFFLMTIVWTSPWSLKKHFMDHIKKILLDSVKKLYTINCKKWLQVIEAILIKNRHPTRNKITFNLRAGAFKCIWHRNELLQWIHSHLTLSCYLCTFKLAPMVYAFTHDVIGTLWTRQLKKCP